jgi:stearoyl-CoA desaturase (Delta-9 desaturase)
MRFQKTIMTLVVGLPLLGVITAMVLLWNRYFFWSDLVLLVVLYSLSVLGITIGYHRMLTHQGFKAPEWLRGLILICGWSAR